MSAFDALRAGVRGDRSQFYKDLSAAFYGANRPGSTVSQGKRDEFWLQCMTVGIKPALDCIAAFSETDLTGDLAAIDVPTLFIHGDDDQIVPIVASARKAVDLVPGASLIVHPGGPHGLSGEYEQRVNGELLAFLARSAGTSPHGAPRSAE